MSALAKIHIAKKQLGLDDDTYRDVLERVTGQRSAKGLKMRQMDYVLDEFFRLGWIPRQKSNFSTGKYLPKVQALWIAGWNLGIVRNRNDAAMTAFIKRQTGIDHSRWLVNAGDAAKVIEALKGWLAREGDVDWSTPRKFEPAYMGNPRYQVAVAQWCRLRTIGGVTVGQTWTGNETAATEDLFAYARAVIGTSTPDNWSDPDWVALMNTLGRKLRKAMAEAA